MGRETKVERAIFLFFVAITSIGVIGSFFTLWAVITG
jgi:hypothetical protein